MILIHDLRFPKYDSMNDARFSSSVNDVMGVMFQIGSCLFDALFVLKMFEWNETVFLFLYNVEDV